MSNFYDEPSTKRDEHGPEYRAVAQQSDSVWQQTLPLTDYPNIQIEHYKVSEADLERLKTELLPHFLKRFTELAQAVKDLLPQFEYYAEWKTLKTTAEKIAYAAATWGVNKIYFDDWFCHQLPISIRLINDHERSQDFPDSAVFPNSSSAHTAAIHYSSKSKSFPYRHESEKIVLLFATNKWLQVLNDIDDPNQLRELIYSIAEHEFAHRVIELVFYEYIEPFGDVDLSPATRYALIEFFVTALAPDKSFSYEADQTNQFPLNIHGWAQPTNFDPSDWRLRGKRDKIRLHLLAKLLTLGQEFPIKSRIPPNDISIKTKKRFITENPYDVYPNLYQFLWDLSLLFRVDLRGVRVTDKLEADQLAVIITTIVLNLLPDWSELIDRLNFIHPEWKSILQLD